MLEKEKKKGVNRLNPTTSKVIVCGACTGRQVDELLCCMCDKWQGLRAFSKVQRRTPDKAKCWKCMEETLKVEPTDHNHSSGNDDCSLSGASDVNGKV